MIVVIDNYDSFVYNLVQFIGRLDPKVCVMRNDAVTVDELAAMNADGLLVSPGPCGPEQAGVSMAAIARLAPRMPVFGVCLGLQCIAQVFGATIVRARTPMHGKTSVIHHRGKYLFAGLSNPLCVMRYHSLVADPETLPPSLQVTAETEHGEIMGLRHRTLEVEGVQFHPESVFTQDGGAMLANFVARVHRRAALRASGIDSDAVAS